MPLSPGQRLGRYEILAPLGAGGMGEVYRARDASLGRDLAIKILPPELTRDSTRVERFMQEARAASALNHPHLTSIYEIGTDPVHYIAMELVDGRNLRDVISARRPDLKQALDWLLQVCDALGAAHQAGVVHRDIKPENVMIAGNGYAKVLDFGVAKLRTESAAGAAEATRAALTDAGVMVGTSGYMSPEQARGLATDQRTDIFSVGCVLYECVTGSKAFDAPSAVERMNRVISADPAPVIERAPNAPSDLIRIVRKCLAKDPDERYQTMKDLAIDLRDVRRQLETAAAAVVSPPTVVVARSRGPLVWAVVAIAVVVGGVFLYERRLTAPATDGAASSGRSSIDRLTTTGGSIDSGISADGKYLVHAEAIGAQQTLWVREVETGQERQIVPAGRYAFYGARFAPNGRDVYYTTRGQGYGSGHLNVISRDGGESRVLLSGIVTPVTFSPDGRQIAFYREMFPDQDSSALIVAGADGKNERMLATRRSPEAFTPAFFTGPSWSPDGRSIAGSVRNGRSATAQLLLFDVGSGQPREILASQDDITLTLWLPDGSGIVYVTRSFVSLSGSDGQLWLKPFPDSAPRRITSDLVDYRQVSITADGRLLTAVGAEFQGELYAVPLDGSPPRRIRSQRFDGFRGVVQLRDGSFITSSLVNGNPQVMRLSADGGTRTVLTTSRVNTFPAVSPDESTVAMVSIQDGKFGVWSMRIDGSEQKLLAEIATPNWLSFTPDGRYVICTSYGSSVASTWRIPVDGGQAVEIARQFDRAVVSPDGKMLGGVFNSSVNSEAMTPTIAVIPLDGSSPLRPLQPMAVATGTGVLAWAKDGSGLIASSSERFNLFFFALNGGSGQTPDDAARRYVHPRLAVTRRHSHHRVARQVAARHVYHSRLQIAAGSLNDRLSLSAGTAPLRTPLAIRR